MEVSHWYQNLKRGGTQEVCRYNKLNCISKELHGLKIRGFYNSNVIFVKNVISGKLLRSCKGITGCFIYSNLKTIFFLLLKEITLKTNHMFPYTWKTILCFEKWGYVKKTKMQSTKMWAFISSVYNIY
jgi:hypothetical protein